MLCDHVFLFTGRWPQFLTRLHFATKGSRVIRITYIAYDPCAKSR